jgi:hypothetical protein
MKTAPYFCFNSTMVSEEFYRDIVIQLQVHPCVRAATASVLNRYTNNYNALIAQRRAEAEAKLVEREAVSPQLAAQFKAMCLTGIGRDTAMLFMRHWWHGECQRHAHAIYEGNYPRSYNHPPALGRVAPVTFACSMRYRCFYPLNHRLCCLFPG